MCMSITSKKRKNIKNIKKPKKLIIEINCVLIFWVLNFACPKADGILIIIFVIVLNAPVLKYVTSASVSHLHETQCLFTWCKVKTQ